MMNKQSNAAFIHINKTGGTSVLEALDLKKEHLTALEMRKKFGYRWVGMYKFTIVRNPWDKVVSHYHYRVKTNQSKLRESPLDFNDWVVKAYALHDPRYYDNKRMFMPQMEWISDEQGNILVDFIARYENIDKDFNTICKNLRVNLDLPHLNSTKHEHYRTYYTEETKKIVHEEFKKDILKFNYSF